MHVRLLCLKVKLKERKLIIFNTITMRREKIFFSKYQMSKLMKIILFMLISMQNILCSHLLQTPNLSFSKFYHNPLRILQKSTNVYNKCPTFTDCVDCTYYADSYNYCTWQNGKCVNTFD
jgi:hypothetical protein